tara:strand:- start:910 stop:1197 length:288 start_codon:yes stop_codon:yes gene_type:complete
MKVYNMKSSNGNKVPNQFIIEHNGKKYFQSYRSVIAVKQNYDFKTGKYEIILDEQDWDYSRTTGKYRNEFLGEGIEATRKKIKDGTYKLTNLNRY